VIESLGGWSPAAYGELVRNIAVRQGQVRVLRSAQWSKGRE
jgi:hypothetical protein